MILVYAIVSDHRESLRVQVMRADGRDGGALGREVYPAPAKSMLKNPPASLTLRPSDRRILMQLVMNQSVGSDEIHFNGASAYAVLEDMIRSGRCYLWQRHPQPLRWGKRLDARLVWHSDHDGVRPDFDLPGNTFLLPAAPPVCIDTDAFIARPLSLPLPALALCRWVSAPRMLPEDSIEFLQAVIDKYPSASFPEPKHIPRRRMDNHDPTPSVTLVRPRDFESSGGDGSILRLRLTFRYMTRTIAPSLVSNRVCCIEDGVLFDIARRPEVERAAQSLLTDYGFEVFRPAHPDLFQHACEEEDYFLPLDAEHDWFDVGQNLIPRLQNEGWSIDSEHGAKLVTPDAADWYSELTPAAGDSFVLETGIRVDGKKIDVLPHIHRFLGQYRGADTEAMLRSWESKTFPVATEDGLVLLPGNRVVRILRGLFELFADQPFDKRKRLRLDAWRGAELLAGDTSGIGHSELPPTLTELAARLTEAPVVPAMAEPTGLETKLRSYQRVGLGWLAFLREHGLGGILADDMGLGKTVQTIAMLLTEFNAGRLTRPVLIVAPTSVLANWRAEFELLAPTLRVLVMHGQSRQEHFDSIAQYHVVVTSYALLRIDADRYLEHEFSVTILDEAQAIKNADAKTAQVASRLRSDTRFCLTGTPMENHLEELWSLMDFANPGVLGSRRYFRHMFRFPIERQGNRVVRRALERRIRPFLLRRTKDLVARELPPKSVFVQSVNLSDVQADLYESVRASMEKRVREELARRGLERSRIIVLDALLKLRQVCCDPRLRNADREYALPMDSCKLAALTDMLPEMVEEGRRILLFSQFTSMLDLIKEQLAGMGLDYVEIRGSTKDRETPVHRFQSGETPLFLLSLKAGGTGLNLTAADTVIHYDPWWNPAVETQATDRAHRIGQNKPVFVYKLIASGTIEARIMDLQARKRDLVESILTTGKQPNEGLVFDRETIDSLLSPLGKKDHTPSRKGGGP